MYGSAVHPRLTVIQIRDKCMAVLTVIQIRDKCMAVSAPKPYCHTNKRQMYGSAVHPSVTVVYFSYILLLGIIYDIYVYFSSLVLIQLSPLKCLTNTRIFNRENEFQSASCMNKTSPGSL